MKRLFSVVLFVAMTAPCAFAITVDGAVEQALLHNPDLQALRLQETAAKGTLEQAGLLLRSNPVLEGSSSKKKYPSDEGGRTFNNYEVRVSQEFEIAGQRGLRLDTAEQGLERTSLEIKDRERVLVAEVKDAYAKALAAKSKRELAEQTVKLQEELYEFAEIKFKAGDVAALEMNLAAVELGKARRDLLLSSREYRERLLALQGLLGMKPNIALGLEGTLPFEAPATPDPAGLKQLAVSRRPDIQAASADVNGSASAAKLAAREAFPNVTLSGFYEKDERADISGMMLSLPLPLFNRNQAERKQAQVRSRQAVIRQASLERSIERELEEAYSGLLTAVEELALFRKEILDKALENLELMNLAYKEGKIGFFEVRLAQKDSLDAQLAYLDSQLRTQQALNALEKATGGSLK